MLHESKKLLLHEKLLLMHGPLLLLYGLLLLLDGLLLALELVLPSLKLSKCSSCLLSLACLVLPHPLKYSKKSEVYLQGRWR